MTVGKLLSKKIIIFSNFAGGRAGQKIELDIYCRMGNWVNKVNGREKRYRTTAGMDSTYIKEVGRNCKDYEGEEDDHRPSTRTD